MMKAADVLVSSSGSVVVFLPCSGKARTWIKTNVHTQGWQWFGDQLVVDHRYAWDLANGMQDAGLEVR